MVLTNYRDAEKNNSHEMDVKKEQLFPVGGILASSEGWGRPCVEGAACAKLGNWEGSVPVGRGQGQGPRHMVLPRMSWGRVGKEQGHAEESPERPLEPPFHSSRGTSQRVQHDQICVLYKQVLSRGQFSNLSGVLTFVSFNSVIPEEIIRNVCKDLCPALLIIILFIIAQNLK